MLTIKFLNIRTPRKYCYNYPKIGTVSFYYPLMGPKKSSAGIANTVDLNQTAPDLGLHCLPKHVSDQRLHCLN